MDELKATMCKLFEHKYKYLTSTANKEFDIYVCERCGKQLFTKRIKKVIGGNKRK